MLTLTGATTAAKNADAQQPYCLLKWELPAPIGTLWFAGEGLGDADGSSWDNPIGRVIDWGVLRSDLAADKRVNVVSDLSVVLRDDDKVLWGYTQTAEPQRTVVTLYQQFKGLGEADLVAVFKGIVNAPVEWSEQDHTLRLDLTDIATYRDQTIGHFATEDDFPDVRREDQDNLLPIVVGKMKRSPTRAVQYGAVTALARNCNGTETTLFVNDARDFPQDEPITIVIDGERVEGSFHGNVFHVTARGGSLYDGTVTTEGDITSLIDSALTGDDEAWAGYWLQVQDPGGTWHRKYIRHYDSTNHKITYGLHFQDCIIYPFGSCWTIPVDTAYSICTWARGHEAGARVYLLLESYVYILNDAPSKAVHQLEGFGRASGQNDYETFLPLNTNWYAVNLNDTTTFPALGRAVTTATFTKLPSQFNSRLRDDQVWADIEGIETNFNSTGDLIENPADVIEMFHQRFQGMTPGMDTDSASFSAAATATALLKMAFTLTEARNGMDLCADLAFQARCAEVWVAGQARLHFLENKMTGPGVGLLGPRRLLGSLAPQRRDYSEVVSEVNAHYTDRGEKKTVTVENSAAETAYGRRAREIEIWAYARRVYVKAIATFWLNRWRFIWENYPVVEGLRQLHLELHDVVGLDLSAWLGSSALSRVVGVEHALGGGSRAAAPSLKLTLQADYWDGSCDTIAEAGGDDPCWACETSCQAVCELTCQTIAQIGGPGECTWSCETQCETGCETSCETGCEIAGCQTGGCETDCETGCEVLCQTGCEGICECSCESGCEIECELGCEIFCETGCEATCQTGGCETSCELGCEGTGCETGCEVACQTGCEVTCELECEASACETGCEVECEAACETECQRGCETHCQSGCEVGCQVGCETECELACEATGCEQGCEVICQVGCETGCEAACETSCQTGGCEVSCESACEATGCEAVCETACQTGGCETSCETGGCEVSCETGCEAACQTGCEVACQIGCEIACQTGCELECQTGGCETICETGCEVACQTGGCETSCETGAETGDPCAFVDNFNRDDENPLAGGWDSVNNVQVVNQQWHANGGSGAWPPNVYSVKALPSGCEDNYATFGLAGGLPGVLSRYGDSNNFWLWIMRTAVWANVWKVVAGVYTPMSDAGWAGGGYCIEQDSTGLRFRKGGPTGEILYQTSDSANYGYRGVGGAADTNGGDADADNFEAGGN